MNDSHLEKLEDHLGLVAEKIYDILKKELKPFSYINILYGSINIKVDAFKNQKGVNKNYRKELNKLIDVLIEKNE